MISDDAQYIIVGVAIHEMNMYMWYKCYKELMLILMS